MPYSCFLVFCDKTYTKRVNAKETVEVSSTMLAKVSRFLTLLRNEARPSSVTLVALGFPNGP